MFFQNSCYNTRKLKKKFDACYSLAKENVAFVKYLAILELEECHGVDGFAYKAKDSAKYSLITKLRISVSISLYKNFH